MPLTTIEGEMPLPIPTPAGPKFPDPGERFLVDGKPATLEEYQQALRDGKHVVRVDSQGVETHLWATS